MGTRELPLPGAVDIKLKADIVNVRVSNISNDNPGESALVVLQENGTNDAIVFGGALQQISSFNGEIFNSYISVPGFGTRFQNNNVLSATMWMGYSFVPNTTVILSKLGMRKSTASWNAWTTTRVIVERDGYILADKTINATTSSDSSDTYFKTEDVSGNIPIIRGSRHTIYHLTTWTNPSTFVSTSKSTATTNMTFNLFPQSTLRSGYESPAVGSVTSYVNVSLYELYINSVKVYPDQFYRAVFYYKLNTQYDDTNKFSLSKDADMYTNTISLWNKAVKLETVRTLTSTYGLLNTLNPIGLRVSDDGNKIVTMSNDSDGSVYKIVVFVRNDMRYYADQRLAITYPLGIAKSKGAYTISGDGRALFLANLSNSAGSLGVQVLSYYSNGGRFIAGATISLTIPISSASAFQFTLGTNYRGNILMISANDRFYIYEDTAFTFASFSGPTSLQFSGSLLVLGVSSYNTARITMDFDGYRIKCLVNVKHTGNQQADIMITITRATLAGTFAIASSNRTLYSSTANKNRAYVYEEYYEQTSPKPLTYIVKTGSVPSATFTLTEISTASTLVTLPATAVLASFDGTNPHYPVFNRAGTKYVFFCSNYLFVYETHIDDATYTRYSTPTLSFTPYIENIVENTAHFTNDGSFIFIGGTAPSGTNDQIFVIRNIDKAAVRSS